MPETNDAQAAADKAAQDAAAAAKAAETNAATTETETTTDDEFKDADKAALTSVVEKERKARRDAEKAAKDAQKQLDDIAAEKLSEAEKLQKRADEAEAKVSKATDKLRKANLLTALGDLGLSGAKAKAAARLLDTVEFNEDDEPTNLAAAVKTASAEYGEDTFKASNGRVAGDADAGRGDAPTGGDLNDLIRQRVKSH